MKTFTKEYAIALLLIVGKIGTEHFFMYNASQLEAKVAIIMRKRRSSKLGRISDTFHLQYNGSSRMTLEKTLVAVDKPNII